ncbi:MAG: peptide chain release factor 2 [Planctomycetes bacterium]|nr:peptide chain release factor 2 [Planctomycetota bacterium]
MLTTSEIEHSIEALRGKLQLLKDSLDLPAKVAQRQEIETKMSAAGFWDNQESAQATVARLKELNAAINPLEELVAGLDDAATMFDLAREEEDESALNELAAELSGIQERFDRFELLTLMRGKFDAGNCYLAIHAGSGGTESRDWAAMLMRMYTRYAERQGYDVAIVDAVEGEDAGYNSVTLHIKGPYACGYLGAEVGVHRLVRISPFDSAARRHTSFASVDCIPEVTEDVDVEIDEEDLRIDTYRAGGAGGQHVNKTSSAVRITHLPTNIVVQCQNERSQHQNRRVCMTMLKAKLLRLEEEKRNKELQGLYGPKGEIAWGNQIRSYVLQPYTLVKDHRTEHETGKVQDVLDGDLQAFIEAYLRKRAAERRGE